MRLDSVRLGLAVDLPKNAFLRIGTAPGGHFVTGFTHSALDPRSGTDRFYIDVLDLIP